MAQPAQGAAPLFNITNENREKLITLLQDANGDAVYSNTRAMFGFVPANQFLVIPRTYWDDATMGSEHLIHNTVWPSTQLAEFGSDEGVRESITNPARIAAYCTNHPYLYDSDLVNTYKIAFLNFMQLRSANIEAPSAFVAASLRARWCALGAIGVLAMDTEIPNDEVFLVDANAQGTKFEQVCAANTIEEVFGVDTALAVEFLVQANTESHGTEWVTRNAEVIWCASEYVMRVRGHHYKTEYDTLLRKYFNASNEGTEDLPDGLEMAVLFRTSIHPFGLRALPNMVCHFGFHGKISNAAFIRLSGAPNGMAVVTTTAACLRAMSGEAWFMHFIHAHGADMAILFKYEKEILAHKFEYHLAARIYGMTPALGMAIDGTNHTIDMMRSLGGRLAAFGQGFIEAMMEALKQGQISEFSFKNAKALSKHSANNPLSTLRIKTLVLLGIDMIGSAPTMTAAVAAALPVLTSPPPAQTTAVVAANPNP